MMYKKYFLLIFFLIISCAKNSARQQAFDFRASDLNGNTRVFSEYRGKVVILNIWATWCPPCIREIPDLNELYHIYKSRDVVILGISVDASLQDVRQALNGHLKIDYPVWHAEQDFIRQFQIRSIPYTLIINKEGVVITELNGMQSRITFEQALLSALK